MKIIKILCVALSLITLLITIVFFCWWAMKDYFVFGDQRFDQVRWITAAPTADNRCYRGDMAHDLQSRLLLKGMPRQFALAMLGRPDWDDGSQIEYDLGHCLWDTHGLRLYFGDDGNLIQSRIVQH
ncbi:MAG TPA: hypothetical protein VN084_01390 [Methylophilaceae bacterium]|nr:hypothetical protein [Methylophilaceae bacterium]